MPYVNASDGCRIYYEEEGTGEPLLLIAGAGASLDMWTEVRPSFERRYRVLTYDHRGVGNSDAPTEPAYSVDMFAADAVAVLDTTDVPGHMCTAAPWGDGSHSGSRSTTPIG